MTSTDLIKRESSISLDRTGGRTGSGFEFEDLEIDAGEDEFAYMVLGRTERRQTSKASNAIEAFLAANREFVVQALAHAISLAVDQILPKEMPEKLKFYEALTTSLDQKINTLNLGVPQLRQEPLSADDELTYERHESQEAISRFLKLMSGSGTALPTARIYTDEELDIK